MQLEFLFGVLPRGAAVDPPAVEGGWWRAGDHRPTQLHQVGAYWYSCAELRNFQNSLRGGKGSKSAYCFGSCFISLAPPSIAAAVCGLTAELLRSLAHL